MDAIAFSDEPAKRREASRLGQDVWSNRDLPAKLRAQGAFIVGQVFMKEAGDERNESKRSEARTWIQRAVDLDSRPIYRNLLDQI